ncbi:MAG TPA: BTAD domain-containing putative transcriptional regulator, partial [Longimicrobiales bacterium]
MYQLNLFGIPTLDRDGDPVTGRATHRHRLALLALLAMAPGQRLSRDKLIAYLWPERDGDSGRNLLKVGTYVLRSGLGDDVIISEGDDLRLNREHVVTDVGEFEAALEHSDFERAASLYRGPFLDGFFLSEAPEFERWTDRERDRLAAGYRSALESLAESAERAGDFAGAADWWRTRAAHDPYDSRVALRLMQSLESAGNRASALQHAAAHERLLEEEFGMHAPAEITEFVDRLRNEPAPERRAIVRVERTAAVSQSQI